MGTLVFWLDDTPPFALLLFRWRSGSERDVYYQFPARKIK